MPPESSRSDGGGSCAYGLHLCHSRIKLLQFVGMTHDNEPTHNRVERLYGETIRNQAQTSRNYLPIYLTNDHALKVILTPGDNTRYELLITWVTGEVGQSVSGMVRFEYPTGPRCYVTLLNIVTPRPRVGLVPVNVLKGGEIGPDQVGFMFDLDMDHDSHTAGVLAIFLTEFFRKEVG